MSNNILWLKSRRNGEKVALAKFYPSTGWYATDDLVTRLDEMFDGDKERVMFDGDAYELEYDILKKDIE